MHAFNRDSGGGSPEPNWNLGGVQVERDAFLLGVSTVDMSAAVRWDVLRSRGLAISPVFSGALGTMYRHVEIGGQIRLGEMGGALSTVGASASPRVLLSVNVGLRGVFHNETIEGRLDEGPDGAKGSSDNN